MKFSIFDPRQQAAYVEQVWNALQARCAHPYFLSWGWVSTWLKTLPPTQRVWLIAGFSNGEAVLAFFVGTTISWLPVPGLRRAALNATGNEQLDKIYVEYNGLLADPETPLDFDLFRRACGQIRWTELRLPGLSCRFAAQLHPLTENPETHWALLEETTAAYWVNLEQVRAQNMDYAALLSANKRAQIRRSIKEYEKDGPITVQEAQTPQQALRFLEQLANYHQKEWQERGRDGAFSNEYFRRFHHALITERFAHGEIQLLRVAAPNIELGYLYNFVYHGRVYFYQSGFNYQPGNLHRPGLVSHYYAVLRNAQHGHAVYDFMAGQDDYKKSLSTDSEPMYWLRLFRSRPVFWAWKAFAAAKKRAKTSPLAYQLLQSLKKPASSQENER